MAKRTSGEAIREVRQKSDLSQVEVAEKADISVNHYAKVERGEVVPGLDTFEAIVKAIGVRSSDILPF